MTDEKEQLINEVVMEMNLDDRRESQKLKNILFMKMNDYSLTKITRTDIVPADEDLNNMVLRMFFVAKNVQGCTKRTLETYKTYLGQFFRFIQKPVNQIDANDIRYFLAVKKERDGNTDTNVNNHRRILSSFFGFAFEEEYISKNPMVKVHKIRTERYVKKAFKDIEIEKLRAAAINDVRLTALLEVLLSTGCRIAEVESMNRNDIDGDEITVYGKGKKQRVVYLNAKARLALERYLKTRVDDNEAMFVSLNKPYSRLRIAGMGICIRELGREAGVSDTHPHRFRRTAATMALNRGMPIDQVQIMLGHASIETTTIYATSAQEVVKANHKKYVV